MKKTITFESAALAMVKSTLIEYLEENAFNPDGIDLRRSIFRKKLKLSFVKTKVPPTKYGMVESKRGEMQTIGGAYVDLPAPGRRNHYKDISVTADVEVDAVSEEELGKEFDGPFENIQAIQNSVDAAIDSVEGSVTAVCRMEIVRFGNVWSPVSVTAIIDGKKEWCDFLSGYDTQDCSLPRKAKIDEHKPEFDPEFEWLLTL